MASTRSRPGGREQSRPITGGVFAEHATKIYWIAGTSIVVIVAFLALTSAGHVVDAATQHFMLFYAGVVTLMLLCASVASGLVATDRMFLHPGQRVFVQAVHRAASFGAVTFLIIHIFTEILAQRVHVIDAFIPFLSPYRTFYIGLGTIAGDIIILLVVTGIMRGRFNSNGKAWRWRAIHYSSYASFIFGIWHGLLAGRPAKPYYDWTYGVIVAFALGALAVRVLSNSLKPKESLSAPPVPQTATSASAPLRAAAMAAQLSVARGGMLGSRGPDRVTGAQPALAPLGAPVLTATVLPATGPQPTLSTTGAQPYYEPGYEGPPRYLGAPRDRDTGPLPRPAIGALPRPATGPLPRAGTGPLPRAGTGPMPRATGSMPRVTGSMPRDTGSMPRVTPSMPRDTGSMPRVTPSMSRDTGSLTRATGPLPVAGPGPLPPHPSGPLPQIQPGYVPPGGFTPPGGRGPLPSHLSGPLPQIGNRSLPYDTGAESYGTASQPYGRGSQPYGPPSQPYGPPSQPYGTGSRPRPAGLRPGAGTGSFPVADPWSQPRPETGPIPRLPAGPPQAGGSMPADWNNTRWDSSGWGSASWGESGYGNSAGNAPNAGYGSSNGYGSTGYGSTGYGSSNGYDYGSSTGYDPGVGYNHADYNGGPYPTGPYPRAATGPLPRAATGPLPPAGARGQAGPVPPPWPGAGPAAGARRRLPAGPETSGPAGPPWDDGFPEADQALRYREPGPGMPGYRGSRDHRYGGDKRR